MKKGLIIGLLVLLTLGAYFASAKIFYPKPKDAKLIPLQQISKSEGAPEGNPSVSGRVVSVAGNTVVLAKRPDETSGERQVSEADRAQRRSQMESMTEAQREESRAQRQQQINQIEAEQLSINLPESATIIKVESGKNEKISIAQIEVGKNINIWKNKGGEIIYVSQNLFGTQAEQGR